MSVSGQPRPGPDHPDDPGEQHASGSGPRGASAAGRALVLPLAGMLTVVLLVGMSMVWPVDAQVVTAAVTSVITLAAAAGGFAAGAARHRD
jgi:hypothetical protein